ncbi:hypothetical protein TNCV_3641601 [Trichonephila clavipes]|nr:hypothetical protein TNCV_3641601 [Trichonephila clavipes]
MHVKFENLCPRCCYLSRLIDSNNISRSAKFIMERGWIVHMLLVVALSPIQVTEDDLARVHPNFKKGHHGGGQGPPTSIALPPTSREAIYSAPIPQRRYTFTNILSFIEI